MSAGPQPASEGTRSEDARAWARLDPAVRGAEDPGVVRASTPRPSEAARGKAPWNGRRESPRPGVLDVLTRILVAVAVPLAMLAAGVRLVATPLFLWVAYHRPGFPEDPYGFTAEDRMVLGAHGMDYILNWAPGAFLGSVRTPDGRPWFTADEVSHMTDVKQVLQLGLWAAVAVVLVALVLTVLRRRDRRGLLGAVAVGGWLTVAATAVLAMIAAVAWQWFFAAFHGLFFSEGTWTFRATDTLIRLYPTQFWIDAAAVIGVITVGGALLAALVAQRARARS